MKLSLRIHLAFAAVLLMLAVPAHGAEKLKLCKKGKAVFAAKKCGKGSTALTLSALTGAKGEDGTLGVYGDGSAGPLSLSSGSTDWRSAPPPGNNLQFSSCAISAGATLFVPSGTIIRCSESVDIAGDLSVLAPVNGGVSAGNSSANSTLFGLTQAPGAGISLRPASVGEAARTNAGNGYALGGFGGEGLISGYSGDPGRFLASLLRVAHLSGGGGAAPSGSGSFASSEGGRGGGAVIIIAKNIIHISGTISANASSPSAPFIHGAGGGGGGIVILAAGTSITFSGSGSVQAKGSNGDQSGLSVGPGGGGGGGLIQYISPSVPTIDGTNSQVTGGSGGASPPQGSPQMDCVKAVAEEEDPQAPVVMEALSPNTPETRPLAEREVARMA